MKSSRPKTEFHMLSADVSMEPQAPRSGIPHASPAWFDEFSSALSYADHIVLSGNLRDFYPTGHGDEVGFQILVPTLTQLLARRGIKTIYCYDPIDGLLIAGRSGPRHDAASMWPDISVEAGASASLQKLAGTCVRISETKDTRTALIVDYASHLHGSTAGDLEDFFIRIDKATRGGPVLKVGTATRSPMIWLVDHPTDLPDWFVSTNDRLREIQVEYPDLEERFRFAVHLSERLGWNTAGDASESERYLQQFALECDGETLVAMHAIALIAGDEGFDLSQISDAIRIYRTGSRRNPWTSRVLFARVRQARTTLEARIKGQPRAIDKTLDILARSILGLSGAQSGPRHQKPRGVLFFAGPTGVGKTELAKAVTELLFGDEGACVRFDMSEFMEEESVTRLIGAPPGQPGHERGGELVNAANRKPFSVFLFDEIEKAHPRVLDMFLQILDEGRLTDSRGATARFSQSLIVFTSNIGTVQGASTTNRGMSVLPSDSHEELEAKITTAVHDHFRTVLRRPELVSRIGQNIVVFDFLSSSSAGVIFDSLLERVIDGVFHRHGLRIELTDKAHSALKSLCTHDHFDGGRGIGNRIETHFVNPLARQMFDQDALEDLKVDDVVIERGKTILILKEPEQAISAITPARRVAPSHPITGGTGRRLSKPGIERMPRGVSHSYPEA